MRVRRSPSSLILSTRSSSVSMRTYLPTKKKAGRPKKVETIVEPKKKAGRPKKTVDSKLELKSPVKRRGRPSKTSSVDIDAYLKEIDNEIAKENARIKATRMQLEKKAKISKKK